MSTLKPTIKAAGVLVLLAFQAQAQEQTREERLREAAKTEVWQPVPTVETPLNAAPSDAIVLFDGNDLSAWESEQGGPAPWRVADGVLTVVPRSKDIRTKQHFCDIQLHLEWRTSPVETTDRSGQGRGNSGVFLQGRYEVQILDSYNNETYANGQAASIYKQAIPLVNASRAPGEWQSYDMIWKAPRFSQGGGLISPASITLLHNGVLVQNETVLAGATTFIGAPSYSPHGCAPLYLQDHGDEVSFRNIWVREL